MAKRYIFDDSGIRKADVPEHNFMGGRSEDDCHPISAITGLQSILDGIKYRIEFQAATDITAGDEISLNVNGHIQSYPATGGEGSSEFTTDTVLCHAAIFLDDSKNQGVIAWSNSTDTNKIYFRVAQGNTDGTISYSAISSITAGSSVDNIRLCRIDNTKAGMAWTDGNGANMAVIQRNDITAAPTIGTQRNISSGAKTDIDICWIDDNDHLMCVYCHSGQTYNLYSTLTGINVDTPPEGSVSMCSGVECRCVSEGSNVIAVSVSSNMSYWREGQLDDGWFGSDKYDDMTDTETQNDCDRHCGLTVSSGTIRAQFEHSGKLYTYTCTYTTGSNINTPGLFGSGISGTDGDLIKSSSGINYSCVIDDDDKISIYEASICCSMYEKIYSTTYTVDSLNTEIHGLMFGSVFAFGIGYVAADANDIFLIDSAVTRTDHFIGIAVESASVGENFLVDIALPIIILADSYAAGTTYKFGPYKYQIITDKQAVIIIEATTIM